MSACSAQSPRSSPTRPRPFGSSPSTAGFIVEDSENPGGADITVLVDDLDEQVEAIVSRGIEPAERVTYESNARKTIYRDADGNEIAFGEATAAE
jgi:hypothetical protein